MEPTETFIKPGHEIESASASARPAQIGSQRHSLGQRPVIVWLTGLSGAGKSTIAQAAGYRLRMIGRQVVILDGDDLRAGLNQDLGFSSAHRKESMRRAAEIARLMAEAGLLVIVALISPYRHGRAEARRIAGDISFLEVFVDTPSVICEGRDPKGLYAKARGGKISNFTNISDPYETPEAPDIIIKTHGLNVEQSAKPIIDKIMELSAITK
ncbi:adenylyl-sulfate kinase [Methylobacterium sp.]|jgi:adenylyl-sulfate kinase|uniref:adenylyl-sulfate kinase n=1 Tax=Methylobacterium sp. TaxID=409 RepID=UPI000C61F3A9|nr:adenylyl-sulfate kinase [Methylobacterium sp.]MBP29425.1 adenylyl-sulfate kinase [Methylobacterium sp.]